MPKKPSKVKAWRFSERQLYGKWLHWDIYEPKIDVVKRVGRSGQFIKITSWIKDRPLTRKRKK